ncbi:hypothetical protein HOY34_10895 [Xinfangfangia sp. D13-10-4-6]|uniref:hypothetical protein n=1 Tax=Pseudogemmobacter hezensis TaxID=2737662 RepID=UPI001555B0DD|nr:hypothetical protein [Pseudogemmobacter hezensis]NPD15709.1 hypothetical protein [Pseudogemmobacter hezensis]
MTYLIWPGAFLSLLGVLGLVWCVIKGLSIRRSGASDDQMRLELRKLFTVNFASLGLSVLGLALVILGISLG